jgi:hypothetical protein
MRASSLLLGALAASLAGCGDDERMGSADAHITFYGDVLPLAERHCSGCHASGSIAMAWPESVDLAQQSSMAIADAVRNRVMPPWLASDDCEPLAGSRALTDEEIAVFVRWNELGAPAGSPDETPSVERMPVPGLAHVGAEVVTPPYVPATDSDDWHCVVVDPRIDTPRDLIGIQISPSLRARAHHVLVYRVEQTSPEVAPSPIGCETLGESPVELIGSWVLGTPPTHFPRDTGIPLRARDRIMIESHYAAKAPDGTGPSADVITVGLEFSDKPVTRPARIASIGMFGFAVPPYSRDYKLSVELQANNLWGLTTGGATIWGLTPHLHARGRTLTVTQSRGEQSSCLLEVPRWDDRWQEYYFFSNPRGMHVEPDDQLKLTCSWDNASSEIVNFGPTARDEMCLSYLYVTD